MAIFTYVRHVQRWYEVLGSLLATLSVISIIQKLFSIGLIPVLEEIITHYRKIIGFLIAPLLHWFDVSPPTWYVDLYIISLSFILLWLRSSWLSDDGEAEAIAADPILEILARLIFFPAVLLTFMFFNLALIGFLFPLWLAAEACVRCIGTLIGWKSDDYSFKVLDSYFSSLLVMLVVTLIFFTINAQF